MEFEVFKVILSAAEHIDDTLNGLEKALDIQFGDGLLINTQAELLNVLVSQLEHDTAEESVIYKYAFDFKWGKIPMTCYIQNDKYIIDSSETLYKYLMEKFVQDLTEGDSNVKST